MRVERPEPVDMPPDLKLIMAPTSVGIAAAAKALRDEDLCDQLMVSGLGRPRAMPAYTMNEYARQSAPWLFPAQPRTGSAQIRPRAGGA
jgi:rhamnose transport system substrate-binding protein